MVLSELVGHLSLLSVKMNKISKFIGEAIRELGKVTWPTRGAVLRLTIGVVIVSALFALFISFVDVWVTRGVKGLISTAGPNPAADQPAPQLDVNDIQFDAEPVN